MTMLIAEAADRSSGHPRTVAVLTLGCKLNQAESEAIARELGVAGCLVIDRPARADAYVINSCSVTHVADRKTRHLVRLARRLSPDAAIVLTGCYPETAGPEIALATGADVVVPSRDKAGVVRALLDVRPSLRRVVAGQAGASSLRTRAFVKAQEGCNDVCAFCIVPRTRGRERSVPPDEVAAIVREREQDGAQEVVITGTQLGAYGRDLNGMTYGPADVIRAVLAETSVPRIRFSSLQPQDITRDLLSLWEDPRLCRHFHLALQSGSDAVLRRMRRRYTLARYRDALAMIRDMVPDVAITTDVIVGFPGETDEEADDSLAFCRAAGFALMHVFPYSRRPGTTANILRDHVAEPVKRARMSAMLALASDAAGTFRRRFIGRTEPVLWETRTRTDSETPVWEGLTDAYVRVYTQSAHDLRNQIIPVTLTDERADGLWGELYDPSAVLPHPAPADVIPLTVIHGA